MATTTGDSPKTDRVVSALEGASRPMTTGEVAAAAGIDSSNIAATLSNLVSARRIRRVGVGTYAPLAAGAPTARKAAAKRTTAKKSAPRKAAAKKASARKAVAATAAAPARKATTRRPAKKAARRAAPAPAAAPAAGDADVYTPIGTFEGQLLLRDSAGRLWAAKRASISAR